jgi:hypothetical protein
MTPIQQIVFIIYAILALGGLYEIVRIGSAAIPDDRLDPRCRRAR